MKRQFKFNPNDTIWRDVLTGILNQHMVSVSLHSLFREFDLAWNHRLRRETYTLNTGVAGVAEIGLSFQQVRKNWNDARDVKDRLEFKNLVAVPLEFDNLWFLLNSSMFPYNWGTWVVIGESLDYCALDPEERRWHPSSFIRLVTVLNKYFPKELDRALEHVPARSGPLS